MKKKLVKPVKRNAWKKWIIAYAEWSHNNGKGCGFQEVTTDLEFIEFCKAK